MKTLLRITCVVFGLSVSQFVLANAPVVDLNDPNSQNQNTNVSAATAYAVPAPQMQQAPMSQEERIARLEQQLNNMTQMNMPGRIDQLQQQVQQLQGQLEMQTHQMQALNDQQKQYYQDLDQRIQLKNGGAATAATTSASLTAMTPATSATPAAPTASNSSEEQNLYQSAVSSLTAKKYPEATTKLQSYLKTYPNGQYAANAHYWLGEIYFLQSKLDLANTEFTTIVSQYPKDAKVPDAMLKIAFIHANSGKAAQARKELQQIVKSYPGTTAAQLATMRLKTLE